MSTCLMFGSSRSSSQRFESLTTVQRERCRRRNDGARDVSATRPERDGSDPERSIDAKFWHLDKAWQVESLAGENLAVNDSKREHSNTMELMPASPSCRQPERSRTESSAAPKLVTMSLMAVKL